MAVVAVQDGRLLDAFVARGREHREELTLRLEVFLETAVEIEMLRREIGEDGDVDLRAAQLAKRERMARRLENAPRGAGDEQLREELLDLHGFLGALTRLVLPLVVRDLEIHRGGEAGLRAGRLEDVGHQVDRRGLSVGPGDPGELELPRRVIEELRRDVGERCARVGHERDRDAGIDGMLGDHRDSTASDRVFREDVPVTMEARDRDEEGALFRLARVVRDLTNVERRGTFGYRDLRRFKEGAELQRRIRPARRSAVV